MTTLITVIGFIWLVISIAVEWRKDNRDRELHKKRMSAAIYNEMAAEYNALRAERHYRNLKD